MNDPSISTFKYFIDTQVCYDDILKHLALPKSFDNNLNTEENRLAQSTRQQYTTTASLLRSKTPPTNVLDMTLNNLLVRLQ